MVTTAESIIAMARSVKERANDLRALELLGVGPLDNMGTAIPLTSEDVEAFGDTGPDRWNQWRDTYGLDDEFDTSQLGSEFDYIPDLFEKLSFADRGDYDTVLGQLDGAISDVNYAGDPPVEFPSIKSINNLNSGWAGSFPDAFRDKFANKLQYLSPLQTGLIQELAAIVKGHWNIVEGARDSLLSVATETESALTNAIRAGYEGTYMSGGDGINERGVWDAIISITGSALAIAGAFVTPPAGALAISTLVVSQISAGGSLANTFAGIEERDKVDESSTTAGGATVDEIISNMHGAITVVSQKVQAEEQTVADRLQATLDELNEALAMDDPLNTESFQYQPYRPAMADEVPTPGSDQMKHS